MKEKEDTTLAATDHSTEEVTRFRTEITEKIHRIAAREDQTDQESKKDVANKGLRGSVREVLEAFQQEIIRQNIWIRIYDDYGDSLPAFGEVVSHAVKEIMKCALRRHRTGKALAYVEISFLINETGTVVTIEDNAPCLLVEEVARMSFLHQQTVNVLPGGYTIQATIESTPTRASLGEVSVRCVTNCFTRFTLCVPH